MSWWWWRFGRTCCGVERRRRACSFRDCAVRAAKYCLVLVITDHVSLFASGMLGEFGEMGGRAVRVMLLVSVFSFVSFFPFLNGGNPHSWLA